MNPLTLVKRIQNINSKEASLGISEAASWHAKYKDSAYVFVGGVPFDLTEGDLLAVFAQYGEIVDVNLVRDKGTGKSKGFTFIAYEDQRSTNLAVDNLNGAQVLGRTIRVDHVNNYKKKEEKDEETQRLKRESRGVCRAFQKGECTRGAGCKFSHDEQRAANTGWGPDDHKNSRWSHDRFEGPSKTEKQSGLSNHISEISTQEGLRSSDKDARSFRTKGSEIGRDSYKVRDVRSRNEDRLEGKERERDPKEDLQDMMQNEIQATTMIGGRKCSQEGMGWALTTEKTEIGGLGTEGQIMIGILPLSIIVKGWMMMSVADHADEVFVFRT